MICDDPNSPFEEAIKTYEAKFLMQHGMQPIPPSQQSKSSMQESEPHRQNMGFEEIAAPHTYENGKNIDSQSYIEMQNQQRLLQQQHSHGSFHMPPRGMYSIHTTILIFLVSCFFFGVCANFLCLRVFNVCDRLYLFFVRKASNHLFRFENKFAK